MQNPLLATRSLSSHETFWYPGQLWGDAASRPTLSRSARAHAAS
jgi:hypothetical protein